MILCVVSLMGFAPTQASTPATQDRCASATTSDVSEECSFVYAGGPIEFTVLQSVRPLYGGWPPVPPLPLPRSCDGRPPRPCEETVLGYPDILRAYAPSWPDRLLGYSDTLRAYAQSEPDNLLSGVVGVVQDQQGEAVLTCEESGCRGIPPVEPGETLTCLTRSDSTFYMAGFVCGAPIES